MKTIVYTAILGGSDSLKAAPQGADQCVCFTDGTHRAYKGWDLVRHTASDPRREAWRLRCLPHMLFTGYDRVIWVDASFTLNNLPRLWHDSRDATIAALRHHERKCPFHEALRLVRNGQATKAQADRQIADYTRAGYKPKHLSISCILVRDRSMAVEAFNHAWLDQIRRYPGDNTQVSLDYAAWLQRLEIAPLKGTRHSNPYGHHDHFDHKNRRKPYEVVA